MNRKNYREQNCCRICKHTFTRYDMCMEWDSYFCIVDCKLNEKRGRKWRSENQVDAGFICDGFCDKWEAEPNKQIDRISKV